MTIQLPDSLLEKFKDAASLHDSTPEEILLAWVEKFVEQSESSDFVKTGTRLMLEDIELYRLLA